MNTSIESLTRNQIRKLISDSGLPKFRANQLLDWLYKKGISSYEEMTNLPQSLRSQLAFEYPLNKPKLIDRQISKDGTRKYLFRFDEKRVAETVGIPSSDDRLTVCCSSQSGCAMGCDFCATGHQGFSGNLLIGEIVDQIIQVQNDFSQRVSNIVVMGQGEPFLNFDNVIEALRICNDQKLLNIGARRITISTCGVIPSIERFSQVEEQFTLAVSLHSAVQQTRDKIMPGTRKWPLPDLKRALVNYNCTTNRRVTFEYALMRGVNDSSSDLQALIEYCSGLICHVNLIPLNEIDDSPYQPTASHVIDYWRDKLQASGIEASVRNSRGQDIAGACGQLANRK